MSDHNRHFDSFVLDALLGAVAGVHEIIKHTATHVRHGRHNDRFFGEHDDRAHQRTLIRERGTELEIELYILDRPSPARVAAAVTSRLISWAGDMNEADRYAYCEANALAWAAELDKLRPKAG